MGVKNICNSLDAIYTDMFRIGDIVVDEDYIEGNSVFIKRRKGK